MPSLSESELLQCLCGKSLANPGVHCPGGKSEAGEAVKWAMQTEGGNLEQERYIKKFKLFEEKGAQSLCYTLSNNGFGTLVATTCHRWVRVTGTVDHRSNRVLEGRVQCY